MADRKFIRDLNSLIRHDTRKRLKLAAVRGDIAAGVGVATAGDDAEIIPELEELMYIRHYGGGVTNGVYSYDKAGGSPILVGNSSVRVGLGMNDGSIYAGEFSGSDIYKDSSFLFDTTLVDIAGVAVNSTHIVVQDTSYNVHRYLLDGTFVDTFALPKDFVGAQIHMANDHGVGYMHDVVGGSAMAIMDYSGVRIANVSYENISYTTAHGCCKSVFVFCDPDNSYSNYQFKVFNNDGTLIATHSISTASLNADLGFQLSALGVTEDRLFLFGSTNTAVAPNCLIYEHTLTLDGTGLALTSVLGSQLYSVPTPQINNNAFATWQSTAIDGTLMV